MSSRFRNHEDGRLKRDFARMDWSVLLISFRPLVCLFSGIWSNERATRTIPDRPTAPESRECGDELNPVSSLALRVLLLVVF
jgi:hypothetical protein